MQNIYDETGRQWAFLEGKYIFEASSGKLSLWVWGRHLFTLGGVHVGYFRDGWLRDHDGKCIGHLSDCSGGPPTASEFSKSTKPFLQKTPDSWPKRQGLFEPEPSALDEWAVLTGRGFIGTLVDRDGDPRPDAQQRWASVRDRTIAAMAASEPDAQPEAQTAGETEFDGDSLEALNTALANYRAVMDGDDKQAVALARVDLHAAAERFAILNDGALRSEAPDQ